MRAIPLEAVSLHRATPSNTPQCLIPVVMSGIIAVYSLVISVLIAQDLNPPDKESYSLFSYVPDLPNTPPLCT